MHAVAEDPLAQRPAASSKSARGWSSRVIADRAGHADGGALLPERGGGGVHAVDGGDHEQRGVGGAQAGAQLADEVGVAGGVEQVDLDAVVQRAARRPGSPSAAGVTAAGSWSLTVVPSATEPARLIVPVAASSASTSVVLPAPEWPDQHHVAYPAGFVHHRRGAGDSLLLGLLRHGAPPVAGRGDAVAR